MSMLDCTEYSLDYTGPYTDFATAHARKSVLRTEGYRIKIIKNADGLFEIWKKNVDVIGFQRRQGNGRMIPNDT